MSIVVEEELFFDKLPWPTKVEGAGNMTLEILLSVLLNMAHQDQGLHPNQIYFN